MSDFKGILTLKFKKNQILGVCEAKFLKNSYKMGAHGPPFCNKISVFPWLSTEMETEFQTSLLRTQDWKLWFCSYP